MIAAPASEKSHKQIGQTSRVICLLFGWKNPPNPPPLLFSFFSKTRFPSVQQTTSFENITIGRRNKLAKLRQYASRVRKLWQINFFLDALASLEPTQVGRSVGNSFKL